MKRLFLLLAFMALLIMSFFPLILSSVYLFSGFDRQAFLDLLMKIPVRNFPYFAIPLLIICYACTLYLFWQVFYIGLVGKKPVPKKEVYYLEDNNINEKISGMFVRPEVDEQ